MNIMQHKKCAKLLNNIYVELNHLNVECYLGEFIRKNKKIHLPSRLVSRYN